jgi:hypothetical protein
MQDRYVGDIGDFGKYGLLRILSGLNGDPMLKLGVDGMHVDYLRRNDPSFRDCDPLLYDKLRTLLFDNLGLIEANRNTNAIENARLLPESTIFYNQPLAYQVGLLFSSKLSLRNE